MRKVLALLAILVLSIHGQALAQTHQPATVAAVVVQPVFVTSALEQGIITVNYNNDVAAKLEVRMGDVKYYYNLFPGQEQFPLQLGSGQYTITVFENITDNRYRATSRVNVDAQIRDHVAVYLNSIQEVKWDEDTLGVLKAAELVDGLDSDFKKFEAIYNYVVKNIDYDFSKIPTLTSTYLPNIDETFVSNSGICYDHASLLAAMLRSVNIPTKLVKGYATNVQGYHAWNEVYIDGKWLIVDSSVDAQYRKSGLSIKMFKSEQAYQKSREF